MALDREFEKGVGKKTFASRKKTLVPYLRSSEPDETSASSRSLVRRTATEIGNQTWTLCVRLIAYYVLIRVKNEKIVKIFKIVGISK